MALKQLLKYKRNNTLKKLVVVILILHSSVLSAQHFCAIVKKIFLETYGEELYQELAKSERNKIHVKVKVDTIGNLLQLEEVNLILNNSPKLKKRKFVKSLKRSTATYCVYNPEFSKRDYFRLNKYELEYDFLLIPARFPSDHSALPDL